MPSDAVLEFSFIGFVNQTIEVAGRSLINITLEESLEELDEVVVTALGFEQNKDQIGYANSQIKNETLVKAAEPTLLNSLSGKATGVNIRRNSGDPGGTNTDSH